MNSSNTGPFIKNAILLITVIILLSRCGSDEQRGVSQVPDPKQTDGGYVSNPDNILSEIVVQQINQQLASLNQSGKAEVAVVALNSIGDQVPKDFAVELFNYWQIGSKETDNGLLILLIRDQHRVEFETGYGLEGDLPDVVCFRIQQDHMVPYFKSDDYDTGIVQGVNALIRILSEETPLNEIPDTTFVNAAIPEFSDVTWYNNTYILTTNRNISLLQAWSTIRSIHGFDLPEIPDTTLSTVEKLSNGYTYTIRIPYTFSFATSLEGLLNSFFFFIVYGIIILIMAFVAGQRDRGGYYKSEKRVLFSTFRNTLYTNNVVLFLFLAAGPIILLEIYFFTYQELDAPPYISIAAGYITWCAYVHLHYMVLIPIAAARLSQADRHHKHEAISEAYRNLKIYAFIFPVPFLWLFYRLHVVRMRKYRDTPYTCECGARMSRLNEVQDNEFLSSANVMEEELMSVDYDVWICNLCSRQRVVRYENYQSKIMRCKSCSQKTVKMERSEVVSEATTRSSGYGYNHYLCRNCGEATKIRFTIPKESSSDSSSSGSDSSSSSSWGGGSSGGGGAGSSW